MLPAAKCRPSARYCLRLRERQTVDRPLVGLCRSRARPARHRRRDHERSASSRVASSDEARSLSITAATPPRLPSASRDDRDAAAADGDDDEAGVDQRRDRRRSSTMRSGSRRRDDAPPAAAGVLAHRPAVLVRERRWPSASSMNEPIGLRGLGERRVVGGHLDLRHDRDRVTVDPSRRKSFSRFCAARSRSRPGCRRRRRRAAPRAARARRARTGAG